MVKPAVATAVVLAQIPVFATKNKITNIRRKKAAKAVRIEEFGLI